MAKMRTAPAVKTPKRATPSDRIPRRVLHARLDDHLEIMTRAIFQAGLSWAMIDARWEIFREAFERFAVAQVAQYGEFELERLMATPGIVHSAKKISGTFDNAKTLIAIDAEFAGIAGYLARFATYAELLADARGRFAFLGDLSCSTGCSEPAIRSRYSSAGSPVSPKIIRACAKWSWPDAQTQRRPSARNSSRLRGISPPTSLRDAVKAAGH
jgi:3-methyladenine DNA glycosylase Tag